MKGHAGATRVWGGCYGAGNIHGGCTLYSNDPCAPGRRGGSIAGHKSRAGSEWIAADPRPIWL